MTLKDVVGQMYELQDAVDPDAPKISKNKIQEILLTGLDMIAAGARKEGRVTVRGFGCFYARVTKPRKGRNPRTGQDIDVPAKVVLKFKETAKGKDNGDKKEA